MASKSQTVAIAAGSWRTACVRPELIAGKRIHDLANRPFGDGRDNNGDGSVDDPLELVSRSWT